VASATSNSTSQNGLAKPSASARAGSSRSTKSVRGPRFTPNNASAP
jgi:hypothetical protein